MTHEVTEEGGELDFLDRLARTTSRRKFLQWSGLTHRGGGARMQR